LMEEEDWVVYRTFK